MAIELQVSSVVALVCGEPRERNTYQGRGEQRTISGRATDQEGRPVSGVAAFILAEPVGVLADAQLQLPDIQLQGVVPGSVVRVEGSTVARLSGGDYASIRAVVTGERLTPLGNFAEWAQAAVAGKPRAA